MKILNEKHIIRIKQKLVVLNEKYVNGTIFDHEQLLKDFNLTLVEEDIKKFECDSYYDRKKSQIIIKPNLQKKIFDRAIAKAFINYLFENNYFELLNKGIRQKHYAKVKKDEWCSDFFASCLIATDLVVKSLMLEAIKQKMDMCETLTYIWKRTPLAYVSALIRIVQFNKEFKRYGLETSF